MRQLLLGCIMALLAGACNTSEGDFNMVSPDKTIQVSLNNHQGKLSYSIVKGDETIIKSSALGLEFKGDFDLSENIKVVKATVESHSSTWEQPWGEKREIENNYIEYTYNALRGTYAFQVQFRVFNDGVGFRYIIPEQKDVEQFALTNELTEFNMNKQDKAWWIPAYNKNSYEHLYTKSTIESMQDSVHTPLTIESVNGKYICIHEADLTDYASMQLVPNKNGGLVCDLAPWPDGIKVKTEGDFQSPWRTVQIVDTPDELAESYMILNLNPECKIEDTSWIKPGKYVGVWWEMHMKKSTWSQGEKHGANTENVKRYIDFAAKYNFDGVLVEGWNFGWDGKWYQDGSDFRFYESVPAFDMDELSAYGAEKGVALIGHHETGGDVNNYLEQIEKAFQYCNKHGIKVIKTGHVGQFLNYKHTHYGQFAVEYYRDVVELAAKYKICLDVHEPIKDTGIRRTWPNMMTREGARGMEFDAWAKDGGNPPSHLVTVPFTRCLAGPFDFTPGIFEMELPTRPDNQSNMTLAKQLAAYVLIYSPQHMAADLPENYEGNPALQFILDVPVDWEDTKVLDAKIGDYCTIVRKDRSSEDWYLGAATNEEKRTFEQKLTFLDKNAKYLAEIYRDGEGAHWKNNPKAIIIEKVEVDSNFRLTFPQAAGGGIAIRFKKI